MPCTARLDAPGVSRRADSSGCRTRITPRLSLAGPPAPSRRCCALKRAEGDAAGSTTTIPMRPTDRGPACVQAWERWESSGQSSLSAWERVSSDPLSRSAPSARWGKLAAPLNQGVAGSKPASPTSASSRRGRPEESTPRAFARVFGEPLVRSTPGGHHRTRFPTALSKS